MALDIKSVLIIVLLIIMSFFVNVMYYLSWMMMDSLFAKDSGTSDGDSPTSEGEAATENQV